MSVSGLQVVGSVLVTSCLDKLIRCYDLVVSDFNFYMHIVLGCKQVIFFKCGADLSTRAQSECKF